MDSSKNFLCREINNYFNNEKYKTSIKANNYYQNKNDITNKKRYAYIDGKKQELKNLDNNIISHPIFRDLVDQKVNYLLSNDWSIDSDKLSEIFDDNFRIALNNATRDSIKYGVGWLFALPEGKFEYIDGLSILPLWEDRTHTKLLKLIRFYDKIELDENNKEILYKYFELWTAEGVKTYKSKASDFLTLENLYNVSFYPHMVSSSNLSEENYYNWNGEIPFIYIKYNQDETSLLTLVKPLIDMMDKTASDTQDLLSDLSNKVSVITGATGTDIEEFVSNKKAYRIVSLPDNATYTEVGTEPNITSSREWLDHLRNQIYIAGRGFDPLQAIGANASGEARKNLYTSLDLDANQLEIGVTEGIRRCIKFLNLSPILGLNENEKVKIRFSRNIMVNIGEQIENAVKMQSIDGVTQETIIAMTGVVENIEEEIKKAEEEKKENMEMYNFSNMNNNNNNNNADEQEGNKEEL